MSKKHFFLFFLTAASLCTYNLAMENRIQDLETKFKSSSSGLDRIEYALKIAEIYKQNKEYNNALEWYEKVLDEHVVAMFTDSKQRKENIVDPAKKNVEELRKKILQEFDTTLQFSNLSSDKRLTQLEDVYNNPQKYSDIAIMHPELQVAAAYAIARIYEQKQNRNEMFNWYEKVVKIHLKHFYSLQQEIINILINDAKRFLKEGKLDEAIKMYRYTDQELEIQQITKLKEYSLDFTNALDAMKEKRYQEAETIYKKLINEQGLGIVQPFLEEARTKLREQEDTKKEKIKIPEWIRVAQKDVLTNMPLEKNWRIENNWIEVHTQIEVQLLGMTLANLMEDQFNDDLPCLIIIAKTSQNLLVFDMLVFAENVVKSKAMNFGSYSNIEVAFVFVIDKTDDTLSFIKKISTNSDAYIFFDPMIQKVERTIIAKKDEQSIVPDISYDTLASFEAKESWTTPGEAQDEVAKLFELNAQETNIEKEKKQYLELASRWRMHGSNPQTSKKKQPLEKEQDSFGIQESLIYLRNTLRQLNASL